MRESGSPPVIVRTYAPARRIAVIVAVTLLAAFALYVISVSYTHLDVYKRQS